MNNHLSSQPQWWGNFNVDLQHCRMWKIGPLSLVACCLDGEWQLAYKRDEQFDEQEAAWLTCELEAIPENHGVASRYVFRETIGQINLSPMLADRPVISRPRAPFSLAAGEEITLYVSSPLWIKLSIGETQKTLDEIAIQRPSDTWFGPSTREGELSYATTTHCRMKLDELPHRPYRAITPVKISNQANSTLSIERLNVPAPALAIYGTASGQLWTPKIELTRREDGETAALKIAESAPVEAKDASLIQKPRKKSNEGALIRAFNSVFS